MELLDCKGIFSFENEKLPSNMVVPVYSPPHSIRDFPFLPYLCNSDDYIIGMELESTPESVLAIN